MLSHTNIDSTTKVEYIALSDTTHEVVWLEKFITNLSIVLMISNPILLLCNKIGAIAQVKELRSN